MSRTRHKRTNRPRRRKVAPRASTAGDALAEQIEIALAFQRAGQLDQAKEIYCEILSNNPAQADAWHLLGMTLYAGHAYADALECLEKAHTLVGDHPELLAHLALVHHALGNAERAGATYELLLNLQPNEINHLNNYGVFLLENERLDEAQSQLERAVQLDPNSAQAEMNLANCLMRRNRLHDAEAIYRRLLQNSGENLDVLGNLGECLRRQCKWEEAIETLSRVCTRRPTDFVSRLTLARTLARQGQLDEALRRFQELVKECPNFGKARHYYGTTLFDLRDFQAAEREINEALAIDPEDVHALCSLGFLCVEIDRRRQAAECFTKAVKINPRMSEAHGSLLYLMTGDPEITPEELFDEHVRWGEAFGNVSQRTFHRNRRDPHRPLRIGYASGDFREHAVALFFEPLLRLRDRSQFDVFCYQESGVNDDVTARLREQSDHWRVTLGYSDDQVAKMIQDDDIDILVDLAGHTTGNRLTALAQKPAPIQISWLGYPNTTGLTAIDYSLTCEVQNPVGEPTLHTEELIRIPGGSFCFAPPQNAPDVSPTPALRNGHVTFGSLHRPFKLSSKTHELWAAALKACPEAKLIAFNTRFNEASKQELLSGMVARGIAPDRIEVRSTYRGTSYLETYAEIDIGLDATPWAGGTTTMEALWMGVPVVAYYGNNRPSRGTAGIVHHLGRPEWIAKSAEQYGQVARQLAGDVSALQVLRSSLREMTLRTIADQQRFVSELEKAYREVWVRWCRSPATAASPISQPT